MIQLYEFGRKRNGLNPESATTNPRDLECKTNLKKDAHLRVCSARSVRIQGELFGFDDCWACTCCGGTRSLSAADSEDPFSKTKSLTPDSNTCTYTHTGEER